VNYIYMYIDVRCLEMNFDMTSAAREAEFFFFGYNFRGSFSDEFDFPVVPLCSGDASSREDATF